MVVQLVRALAATAMLAVLLAGCGPSEEEKNSYLNAPTVKEKVSQQQSAQDRGLNPRTAASINSRPEGKR